ncbi:hypothetical protein ACOMHN_050483 [Nucella lapillus]
MLRKAVGCSRNSPRGTVHQTVYPHWRCWGSSGEGGQFTRPSIHTGGVGGPLVNGDSSPDRLSTLEVLGVLW